MNKLRKYISILFLRKNSKDTDKDFLFASDISKLVGFKIRDVQLYREAFSLKNNDKIGISKNYERLEFLGDAVLGSIISYYLFNNYPTHNEGYLTQMKSKVVNRKNLNRIGEHLKLTKYIQNPQIQVLSKDISGNLLEALIGAIYLDTHYKSCESFVNKILLNKVEITKLENQIVSYKSLLLEWGQKKRVKVEYRNIEEILPNNINCFRCSIFLNNEKLVSASAPSKKKAEEAAAKRAFYALNKREKIIKK